MGFYDDVERIRRIMDAYERIRPEIEAYERARPMIEAYERNPFLFDAAYLFRVGELQGFVRRTWPLLENEHLQRRFLRQAHSIGGILQNSPMNRLLAEFGKFQDFVPNFSQPALQAIQHAAEAHQNFINTFIGSAINDVRLAAQRGLTFEEAWKTVSERFEEQAESSEKTWIIQYGLQVLVPILASLLITVYFYSLSIKQLDSVEDNIQGRLDDAESRIVEETERQSAELLAKIKSMIDAQAPDLILIVDEEASIYESPSSESQQIGLAPRSKTFVPVIDGSEGVDGWVHVHFFDDVDGISKKGWIREHFVERVEMSELQKELEALRQKYPED